MRGMVTALLVVCLIGAAHAQKEVGSQVDIKTWSFKQFGQSVTLEGRLKNSSPIVSQVVVLEFIGLDASEKEVIHEKFEVRDVAGNGWRNFTYKFTTPWTMASGKMRVFREQ